jgi:regulation of enolase protein 1 (concanavalin A-like superfamily)
MPVWLRLYRHQSHFTAAFAPEGTNWLPVFTFEMSMCDTNYFFGLVACSGRDATPVKAEFDNIAVRAPEQKAVNLPKK